jgi:eukaryotic-like serine/threonine-protein kinase
MTAKRRANRHPPGSVFDGKFKIERELGHGGMGFVLAAMHLGLDERVALKLLLPELADDETTVMRFMREAKAASKIRGEHVGRVFDVGRDPDGIPYLVLEYLDGEDLGRTSKTIGRMPVTTAVDYVLQACQAIAQAHALGIVHRDIKPSNLFLTKRIDGSACVKVLDFGISKQLEPGPEEAVMTQTKEVFGSPMYMSPEQLRASREVDARADIWAIGVVLYELLAGATPFDGESVMAIGGAILHGAPASLKAKRPDVPARLEATILRCLQKKPDDRFQTIADLASALRPFASPSAQAIADAMKHIPPPRSSRPSFPDSIPPDDPSSDPTLYVAGGDETLGSWSSKTSGSGRFAGYILPVLAALVVATIIAGGAVVVRMRKPIETTTAAPPPVLTTTEASPAPAAPPPPAPPKTSEPALSAAAEVSSPRAAVAAAKPRPSAPPRASATTTTVTSAPPPPASSARPASTIVRDRHAKDDE